MSRQCRWSDSEQEIPLIDRTLYPINLLHQDEQDNIITIVTITVMVMVLMVKIFAVMIIHDNCFLSND